MRKLSQSALDQIKKIIDEGRISRVVYMHADHFEPWRLGVNQRYADDLVAFSEMVKKSDFTRKLTLFYKPFLSYGYGPAPGPHDCIYDEPVWFRHRDEREAKIVRQSMSELMRQGTHEIGVHIHHESITCSDVAYNIPLSDWLAFNSNPQRDAERLELFLKISLQLIRDDTGLPLQRWAFVHGNWALNASDHSICQVASELLILQRNGCFGDFTFPAGRKNVNPKIEHPFTCLPIEADRVYDLPAADPQPVWPGTNAISPGRFFIWSSVVKHDSCALDYYGLNLRTNLPDIEPVLVDWFRDSVQLDDTIYVKTHAHSMAWSYWEGLKSPIIPHLHPSIQTLCGHLADVCTNFGLALEFGTARSIYEEFAGISNEGYVPRTGTREFKTRRPPAPAPVNPVRSPPSSPQHHHLGTRAYQFLKRCISSAAN
jgi:hypothetical protein